jgi:hypothetical protein
MCRFMPWLLFHSYALVRSGCTPLDRASTSAVNVVPTVSQDPRRWLGVSSSGWRPKQDDGGVGFTGPTTALRATGQASECYRCRQFRTFFHKLRAAPLLRPAVTQVLTVARVEVWLKSGCYTRASRHAVWQRGRRLGAIRHLQWDDIDFKKKTIRWRADADKRGVEWVSPTTGSLVRELRDFQRRLGAVGGFLFATEQIQNKRMDRPLSAVKVRQPSAWRVGCRVLPDAHPVDLSGASKNPA